MPPPPTVPYTYPDMVPALGAVVVVAVGGSVVGMDARVVTTDLPSVDNMSKPNFIRELRPVVVAGSENGRVKRQVSQTPFVWKRGPGITIAFETTVIAW